MQTHFNTPPTCSIQMQIGMKYRCNICMKKYFHDEPQWRVSAHTTQAYTQKTLLGETKNRWQLRKYEKIQTKLSLQLPLKPEERSGLKGHLIYLQDRKIMIFFALIYF